MRSVFIALTMVTLVFGATMGAVPGTAVAHHNTSHSLAQCGSIVCAGTQAEDTSTTRRSL